MISAVITIQRDVPWFRKMKRHVPSAQRPIPIEDSLNGENRSESFPATGDRPAMIAGWAIMISPVA